MMMLVRILRVSMTLGLRLSGYSKSCTLALLLQVLVHPITSLALLQA